LEGICPHPPMPVQGSIACRLHAIPLTIVSLTQDEAAWNLDKWLFSVVNNGHQSVRER